jgi:hypothetical protein
LYLRRNLAFKYKSILPISYSHKPELISHHKIEISTDHTNMRYFSNSLSLLEGGIAALLFTFLFLMYAHWQIWNEVDWPQHTFEQEQSAYSYLAYPHDAPNFIDYQGLMQYDDSYSTYNREVHRVSDQGTVHVKNENSCMDRCRQGPVRCNKRCNKADAAETNAEVWPTAWGLTGEQLIETMA